MRHFFLWILGTVGLVLTAQAAPESGRTCRIVFPERPNDSPKSAFLFDGKESHEVRLPSMNFSPVLGLPKGDLMLVLSSSPIRKVEEIPPGAPKLKVPEGIRDFYILMTPDRENAHLPLAMKMVSLTNGKLGEGETLWFNLTEHKIVAKLGKNRLVVGPKDATVSKDPLPESGYYRADFAFQPGARGELQPISEQHWYHDAKSRHVGFIVDKGGRLPRIFFYRDFRADT
jgi:hypothetical protein